MLRWEMREPTRPLWRRRSRSRSSVATRCLVRVAGLRHLPHRSRLPLRRGADAQAPPLALGHEVSASSRPRVPRRASGSGSRSSCRPSSRARNGPVCRRGRTTICPNQIFPGNDIHGASRRTSWSRRAGSARCRPISSPLRHAARRARGAGRRDHDALRGGAPRRTCTKAMSRSGSASAAVGGFGVQVARALGAYVVAIDVDPERLRLASEHGASLALDAPRHGPRGAPRSDPQAPPGGQAAARRVEDLPRPRARRPARRIACGSSCRAPTSASSASRSTRRACGFPTSWRSTRAPRATGAARRTSTPRRSISSCTQGTDRTLRRAPARCGRSTGPLEDLKAHRVNASHRARARKSLRP